MKIYQDNVSVCHKVFIKVIIITFIMHQHIQLYFVILLSFITYVENVFLFPDFKNTMFCHHGTRLRKKHDVMTNFEEFILLPHLYCPFHCILKQLFTALCLIFSQLIKNQSHFSDVLIFKTV